MKYGCIAPTKWDYLSRNGYFMKIRVLEKIHAKFDYDVLVVNVDGRVKKDSGHRRRISFFLNWEKF